MNTTTGLDQSNPSLPVNPRTNKYPYFFRNPLRYMRWAAHEKPAIFFSVVIGSMGPLMLLVAPPIKRWYGYVPRPQIPMTYPIPAGPRKPVPAGFEDE